MSKNVTYIYYQMFQSDLTESTVYSLVEIIPHIKKMTLKERILKIDHDKYRLENIETEAKNGINFIHLRFMRLDEANIPNLSYEDRESTPLELQDGEYLGTPLHVLYDINNEIFMIQQNRTTMTVGKLGNYLNTLAHNLGLISKSIFIEFRPIISLGRVRDGAVYTKIVMNFANIEQTPTTDNSDLHRLIEVYNNFQAVTGSVIISLGHYKSKQLLGDKVRNFSRDIENNRDALKSAKIYYKTDDYSGFIDLIEDVLRDEIKFDIKKRSSLSFDYAKSEMMQRYLVRINAILQELNNFHN